MACEDQITPTDLTNAKDDAITLAEIATSKEGGVSTGDLIFNSTDRFGNSHLTSEGALARIQANPINGGVWATGITFNAFNDYMIYTGVAYKPKSTTTLPHVSEAVPNVANVEPFALNDAGLVDLTINGVDTNVSAYLNIAGFLPVTLAEAITSTDLIVGMTVVISDRGHGFFDVVLASGVTANTFDIVASTGSPTLALQLRTDGSVHVDHLGAKGDTTITENYAPFQAAIDYAELQMGVGNKGFRVELNSGDTYKISTAELLVSKPELEFYAKGRANINCQVPAPDYTLNVDLTGASGGSSTTFFLTNVSMIDTTASKAFNGLRTDDVQGGKFTNVHWVGLLRAIKPGTDTNLCVFDNCRWEGNAKGFYHEDGVDGASNNNTFISPIFQANEEPYTTDGNGNTFIGGDFEPANGRASFPMAITGNREVWEGVRIERNINNTEWLRVGSDCEINCSFHGTGAEQAVPAVNFVGERSTVTVLRTLVTQLATFDAASKFNILKVRDHAPLVSGYLWVDDLGEGNSVETAYGSVSQDTLNPKVSVNLVDPDLTQWVKTNMTVVTDTGDFLLTSTAATPDISYTLTGTFENLYVSLSGLHVNAAGDIKIDVNGDISNKSILESTRATKYSGFNGPYTNPIIKIIMTNAGGAGASARLRNITVGEDLISAGKEFIGSNDAYYIKEAVAPGTINAGLQFVQTFTAAGVKLGDFVDALSYGASLINVELFAYVNAANQITVVFSNNTAGNVALTASDVRVKIKSR